MVSNFALLSNLLLASAALAVPSSSPVGAPLAPSHETRQSSTAKTVYDRTHAGVVSYRTNGLGMFTSVTASIQVPNFLGDEGVVTAWVGLDMDGTAPCHNGAYCRAGVSCSISSGNVSCSTSFQWSTEYAYTFSDFAVNSNDSITVNLISTSPTTGSVFFQNEDTGQAASQNYTASESHALCEMTAAWVITSDGIDETSNPLADFDAVEFNGASASDSSANLYTPDTAPIIIQMRNPLNHTNANVTSLFTLLSTLVIQLV